MAKRVVIMKLAAFCFLSCVRGVASAMPLSAGKLIGVILSSGDPPMAQAQHRITALAVARAEESPFVRRNAAGTTSCDARARPALTINFII